MRLVGFGWRAGSWAIALAFEVASDTVVALWLGLVALFLPASTGTVLDVSHATFVLRLPAILQLTGTHSLYVGRTSSFPG